VLSELTVQLHRLSDFELLATVYACSPRYKVLLETD